VKRPSVSLTTVKSVSSTDDHGNEDTMANERSSRVIVAREWEPTSDGRIAFANVESLVMTKES
jgi:hypothetical protein